MNEGCPHKKITYVNLERLQFYVLVCFEGLLKLMMIHSYHCFAITNMIMNCSLSNIVTYFYKGHPPASILTGLFCSIHKIREGKKNTNDFGYKLFNKEPHISYVPEIRNGCDVLEQASSRYCVDPLISSDADRWGYM